MSNRRHALHEPAEQALFLDLERQTGQGAVDLDDRDFWVGSVRNALSEHSSRSLSIAEQALDVCPGDPELLLLGALTATASGQPERSLAFLKRYNKRYVPGKAVTLLHALALGEQQKYAEAHALLRAERLDTDQAALQCFVGDEVMADWLRNRLRMISTLGPLGARKRRTK